MRRFLVSSSLSLIVAQRLIRKICVKCKAPVEVHDEALREIGMDPDKARGTTYYRGTGCIECNNSGYRGRTGIYEVMPITPKIRTMILDSATATDIEAAAVERRHAHAARAAPSRSLSAELPPLRKCSG